MALTLLLARECAGVATVQGGGRNLFETKTEAPLDNAPNTRGWVEHETRGRKRSLRDVRVCTDGTTKDREIGVRTKLWKRLQAYCARIDAKGCAEEHLSSLRVSSLSRRLPSSLIMHAREAHTPGALHCRRPRETIPSNDNRAPLGENCSGGVFGQMSEFVPTRRVKARELFDNLITIAS